MDSICHKIILKSQEYYDFNNTYRLNLNSLSTFLVSKIISQNQANSLIFSIQEQGSNSFIFTKMTYFKPLRFPLSRENTQFSATIFFYKKI